MLSFLAAYRDRRLVVVLFMGFASGLPLALTGTTLGARFTDCHVALSAIGAMALVQLSYNFKPLWAPVLDRVRIPYLTPWLGQRRSWLVLIASCLGLAIGGLGLSDPRANLLLTVFWAVLVAFLSASQDVVIDAYRVEILRLEQQGAGAAVTQFGYRAGMIVSGAGSLYVATYWGWSAAYQIMAMLMLVAVATALLAPEPTHPEAPMARTVAASVIAPFRDMFARRGWLWLFLFIVLYKLGDALSGHMATPFYLQLGFTKIEIANISKVLGVVAAIAGVSLGGAVVYRLGVMPALLVCGVIQMVSNTLYIVQDFSGHDIRMLALTISLENLAGGMGSAAFVAYLSGLCSPGYTATQYALLSALALLGRNLFAALSGLLAAHLGWIGFFTTSVCLALPGLGLLVWMIKRPAL